MNSSQYLFIEDFNESEEDGVPVKLDNNAAHDILLRLQTFHGCSFDLRDIEPAIRGSDTPWITLVKENGEGPQHRSAAFIHANCKQAHAMILLHPDIFRAESSTLDASSLQTLSVVIYKEVHGSTFKQLREKEKTFHFRVVVQSRFGDTVMISKRTHEYYEREHLKSEMLIKGPYAASAGDAIAAMRNDLLQKIRLSTSNPKLLADDSWLLDPLGGPVKEPVMSAAIWTAMNVEVIHHGAIPKYWLSHAKEQYERRREEKLARSSTDEAGDAAQG